MLIVPVTSAHQCGEPPEGQPGFALEEAAGELALDLLQVELLQALAALLHLVLAVGEDERVQVALHLVADDMQVSDLRCIHGVAVDIKTALRARPRAWPTPLNRSQVPLAVTLEHRETPE